jgi:phenylacetate-CoA ligase
MGGFHAQLDDFDAPLSWSRAELEAFQLDRLRVTLAHAYENVPFYRERFDAAGLKPQDMKSLEDIVRFPLTVKEDMRATYPFGLLAVPREKLNRIHASSGTTGLPTIVGYTEEDLGVWSDLVARCLRRAGLGPESLVQVAYGYGLFTGGLGAHYGGERLGATVVPASTGQTARQIQLIRDLKPDAILCTPSFALTLADAFEKEGLDPADTSIKIGIHGAEPWTDAMRAEIEKRLGLTALDIYGLSEVLGPGVACEEADQKGGPTLWEDHFFAELLDPETGEPVPEGEPGELVLTTLSKAAQPLIRYRTKDITRLTPSGVSAMRKMERVTGRSDDMMIISGVNVYPSQIEEILVAHPLVAPHYMIEISKEGRLDRLKLLIELAVGVDHSHGDQVAEELQGRIRNLIGIRAEIEVHEPGSLPRFEGKAKRVNDKR